MFATWFAILCSRLVCSMYSLAGGCFGWFVDVLKASFWNVNREAAATMYMVLASGGLELNGRTQQVRHIVDLSAAATHELYGDFQ